MFRRPEELAGLQELTPDGPALVADLAERRDLPTYPFLSLAAWRRTSDAAWPDRPGGGAGLGRRSGARQECSHRPEISARGSIGCRCGTRIRRPPGLTRC